MSETPALVVEDLTLRYGGVAALQDVSLAPPSGKVTALVGPNGAGKTSLLNVISGVIRAQAGRIDYGGVSLTSQRRSGRAAVGISRTFQNIALFSGLTVLENTLLGAYSRHGGGVASAILRLPPARRAEASARARCRAILSRLGLDGLRDRPVTGLPYGVLKRIELARALAAQPSLLLLDEPAAGLNHDEVSALARLLRDLRAELELTLLLVEHHMGFVVDLSDHVVVLNQGRVLAMGKPAEVAADARVIEAYIGSDA